MKDSKNRIEAKVFETPFIDTHEHLVDESDRLNAIKPVFCCDDWTVLLSLYFKFDLVSAGMEQNLLDNIFSEKTDPLKKWNILKPYWPILKNTASGLVLRETIKTLYNIIDLSDKNIEELQKKYLSTRTKGFYKHIIQDIANIKYAIVHNPLKAFNESESTELLKQDISIDGFIRIVLTPYNVPENKEIKTLKDWLTIIDWWFDNFGKHAKGIKIGTAYFRRLNFTRNKIDNKNELFLKKINSQELTSEEEKLLQDYLFWYCIDKATEYKLPVKLHTGQYAMNNIMDMNLLKTNATDCANLCKQAPNTQFVFFHICYPYYEEMLSLAKHYANAYIDMCWSWTLNPIAAKDFLKKFILTVPNNKIFTFGGDDIIVENLVGHSIIARKGITQALTELVEEEWLSLNDALELIDVIMHKNAEELFS